MASLKRLITKSTIAASLAAQEGLSVAAATRMVEGMVDIVSRGLASGKPVRIAGLGVFKNIKRKPRLAHVPKTGETVKVAARRRVLFRADLGFTRELNA